MTNLTLFHASTLGVSTREAVQGKTVEIKSPIKRLGLLTFSGYRFGVNTPRVAGIVTMVALEDCLFWVP